MKFLVLLFSCLVAVATINIFAQDNNQSTMIPDYSNWNVKSFPIDFNKDGKIDMTFKFYYLNDDVIQMWIDKEGKERVLTVTKSNRIFGGGPTRNFIRINDRWVLSRDVDRKPIKSDELTVARQKLVEDLGGIDNFSEAISRVVFLMYQIP